MGITQLSYQRGHALRRQRRHYRHRIAFKLIKKPDISIDLSAIFEEKLYELNTTSMHLKLYIRHMLKEYTGATRQEIAVFYAMAVNLHKNVSNAYYRLIETKCSILDINIIDLEAQYEGILDLCGTDYNTIYDALFCDEDGYNTPSEPDDLDEVVDITKLAI